MNRDFSDIELSKAGKLIASRMGLSFPEEKWDQLNRSLILAAIDLDFQDLSEFIQWITSDTSGDDLTGILAFFLTNSETYFWREPQVFAAFSQSALADWVVAKKDNGNSLNIWCAACSTGEEAYSIAIALHRTIPKLKDWKISILGTDINTTALSKARKGVYSSWSFRDAPSWLKPRYFKSLNTREFEIIPEIKEMVTFSRFNLTHQNFLSSVCRNRKMDIIFCRNVLMYFTDEWVARISENLFHALSDDGWLAVASCELTSDIFPQFTAVNFPGAVLYRKCNEKIPASDFNASKEPFVKEPVAPTITRDGYRNFKPLPLPLIEIKGAVELQPILKTTEDRLNDKLDSIRLLANKGDLDEALSICNEAISSNKLSPQLYFLRASILQGLYKSHEAIKSLKQVIYIDPNHIMGHFTLGNLYIRQGLHKNAEQYFSNALGLLNGISNDDIFPESEGLSARYIRGIIVNNMKTKEAI